MSEEYVVTTTPISYPLAPGLEIFGPSKAFYDDLFKLQGLIETVPKDANNTFFKSKYADLPSIWQAIKPHLQTCNFILLQPLDDSPEPLPPSTWTDKNGNEHKYHQCFIRMRTLLIHNSGAVLSSSTTMPMSNDTSPQAYGSAVTYLRRYALGALLGIVTDEDDDGNAASGRPQQAAPQRNGNLSPAQIKRLFAIANNAKVTKEQIDVMLKEKGYHKVEDLSKEAYDALCNYLQQRIPETNGTN